MNEFVVYILFSEKFNKTYVGFTANLIGRFYSHNALAKKGYTIKFRPWKVAFVQFFDSKKKAMQFEKFLKFGKGREFINSEIK